MPLNLERTQSKTGIQILDKQTNRVIRINVSRFGAVNKNGDRAITLEVDADKSFVVLRDELIVEGLKGGD